MPIHLRAEPRILRDHFRSIEYAIDVGGDRLRLAQRDVAVAHNQDLAERVDRVDIRGVRPLGLVRIRHALFRAHHAHGPDVVGLRRTDDLKRRHGYSPF